MSKALLASTLLFATVAVQAQAVYKCPQAGGGVAYQATPCAVASARPAPHPTAAQLNALRASAPVVAAARPSADPYGDDQRRRDCTVALQNQMVLKRVAANPNSRAYSTDKSGQKTYVTPGDSAGLVAQNERQAAAKCD